MTTKAVDLNVEDVQAADINATEVTQVRRKQAPSHSSQGGKHGPSQGQGPLGTWLVIAVLLLAIFLMWFLVLGIMQGRN